MILAPGAAPAVLVLLVLALAGLLVLLGLRVLAFAYRRVGVRRRYGFVLAVLSLAGSYVDVPVYVASVEHLAPPRDLWVPGAHLLHASVAPGTTVVAVNLGGALIPALVSLYLLVRTRMYLRMLVGTAGVALIVHDLTRIVPGQGIVVPILAPPLAASCLALLLAFRRAPPVAYVSGSMGALIGADIMNLGRVAELGLSVASIGGAGTFDGVFLTGIIAGLLAGAVGEPPRPGSGPDRQDAPDRERRAVSFKT